MSKTVTGTSVPVVVTAIDQLDLQQRERGVMGWVTSTDHKQLGIMTMATSLGFFLIAGAFALIVRLQLSRPDQHIVSVLTYNEVFTLHGSGMIYCVITPLAVGLCLYLVPLQVGSPLVAAPKLCNFSYWTYLGGAFLVFGSGLVEGGAGDSWYSYTPLADSRYTPSPGFDVWMAGAILCVVSMWLMSGAIVWTALRMRAPGMSLMRMSPFTWSAVVTCLMSVAAFPSLFGAMGLITAGRLDPNLFTHNTWNIAYQYLFWFYGHPVVYVMFFPFMGAVAEVLATSARRKYFGYDFTVFSLLTFAAFSSAVFGHHLFTTGQSVNNYFTVTSIALTVPAGVEYFGLVGTVLGSRLVIRTPTLFALAFIPQFLIGGISGIMTATPVLDYEFHGSYFVVAHFHYTLFGGSVFGAFAALYFWFPKMTGYLMSERLGRINFWLLLVGTNVTFLPMFASGFFGMPRRVATYPATGPLPTLNLVSSIGAGIIACGVAVFFYNVVRSLQARRPAGDDPWLAGQTLEWATSSPPPRFNYDALHPIPRIKSYAPLLDLREEAEQAYAAHRHGQGGRQPDPASP